MKSSNHIEIATTKMPTLDSWYTELGETKADSPANMTNEKIVHQSLLASVEVNEKSTSHYFGKWVEGNQFAIIDNFLIHAKSIRDFHIKKNDNNPNLIGNLSNYIEGIEQLGNHWNAKKSSSFTVGLDLIYLLTRSLRKRTHKDLQIGFEHLRAKNKMVGDSRPMFEVNTPAERDFLLLMRQYVEFFLGKVWYGYVLNGLLNQLKNQFQKKLDVYFKKAREFTALSINLPEQHIEDAKLSMNTEKILGKIADNKMAEPVSIKTLSKPKQSELRLEYKRPMAPLKPLQKREQKPETKPVDTDLVLAVLNTMGIRMSENDLKELLELKENEIEEAFYQTCRY